jgi:hypothetical protein
MMDASQPKLNVRLSAIALDIQNAGFTDVEQLSISAEHTFDDR